MKAHLYSAEEIEKKHHCSNKNRASDLCDEAASNLFELLAIARKTIDVNLGCLGYVYGLWLAASVLQNPDAHRVFSLVGNTISHLVFADDRSEYQRWPNHDKQVLLVGFGVGYSWAASALYVDVKICLPKVIFMT